MSLIINDFNTNDNGGNYNDDNFTDGSQFKILKRSSSHSVVSKSSSNSF